MIDAILEYMEDNGIGTVGTDMFIGELPFDKSECISVVISPSPEPNKSIPYFNQVVDVWARYKSFDDGMNKMKEVFDLFHRSENYEVDGFHIYLSYAMGMIEDFDRDNQRRHLFKLTLGFVYREGEDFS